MSSIAQKWKELSGENDWEGILDPLDIDLRRYLIQYGDKIQAVIDSFIDDKSSKNIGLPRYIKRHLFPRVGLVNGNPFDYEVKKYFYASTKDIKLEKGSVSLQPQSKPVAGYSNWMGYIAVSSDTGSLALGRRDILVVIRGTLMDIEWNIDFQFQLVSASDILGTEYDPKVQQGWYTYYTTADPGSTYNSTSMRDQILSGVRELVDLYKDEEISITVTGHSMGGAFATLISTDIVYNGYNKPTDQPDNPCQVTAFLFASPPVGDPGFRRVFNSLDNIHALQVRNEKDEIPELPDRIEGYVHVGKKLVIDTTQSPYLKEKIISTENVLHDLQVYLHGIAGTQGSTGGFKLEVKRDLALINKKLDALKDEYNVGAEWWCVSNKGMIQMADGNWVVVLDREIDIEDDKP
ncbi:phospholipase A1-IIgamma [Ziziphus jujuba]|uniref:Phospholipase A1 n=1 Tax=Ziziphus jujuba TaxID=326968 RepID=A0A6P4A5T0_ZIZJJ|nr:phospholipase A1-IIgamma [Ziziphus jujuba]